MPNRLDQVLHVYIYLEKLYHIPPTRRVLTRTGVIRRSPLVESIFFLSASGVHSGDAATRHSLDSFFGPFYFDRQEGGRGDKSSLVVPLVQMLVERSEARTVPSRLSRKSEGIREIPTHST